MRIIISDVSNIFHQTDNETKVIDNSENISHCIGCFGCWIKTPGQCVIKDEYSNMGELFGRCDHLILVSELKGFSTWVFVFPLYVDGIPSHLLWCLRQIENAEISDNAIDVYAIVNCGFYEGIQAKNALSMMKNWCIKTDLKWRTGIGFGGGGALESMKSVPLGSGPKAGLGKACKVFADAVLSRSSMDNTYISISFPRFIYKFAAEMGWARMIRANGGKKKDLGKRL